MPVSPQDYPWFGVVEGDEIVQGDIFEDCPVFLPPEDLRVLPERTVTAEFKWEVRDLILLSQSCDLVKGREKIDDVLLCAVWKRSECKEGHLSTDKGIEDVRKGQLPAFHLLAESNVDIFNREVRVVDFRRVYTLPLAFIRKRASLANRLRLMPPYREHLSQSFARFFMRVGLPIDIPPFAPPKGKR